MPRETPAIIDIEASGFGADSDPIEVGVALPDGTRFCSLIEPVPDWTHWDCQAEISPTPPVRPFNQTRSQARAAAPWCRT